MAATVEPAIPLLPYQRADVESAARFSWCCWSRQIGKSFTKSLRRILRGLMRRRDQVFLSAGERQSRELMRRAWQHCQALRIAAELRAGGAEASSLSSAPLELRLPNGVRVIGLPANPQTIRGFSGDVFLDEFTMHRDDRAIWAAVFPTILRGGGELDVASTPKGPANVFARLRANAEFAHSTVTLYDAIAQGLALDAEQIRRSMDDDALFRQEFLCEFVEEAGALLTFEQIAACEDGRLDRDLNWGALRSRTGGVFAGIDIGRRRDLTVLWVLAREDDNLMTLGVVELRQAPFRRQYELLARLMHEPAVVRCCVDATGVGLTMAEAAQEDFGARRVEAVIFTPATKDRMATALKRRIEDRSIRVPVDEAIRCDLHSVRLDVTHGGGGRYVVGSGGDSHADRFWALALAVRAASGATGGAAGKGVRAVVTQATSGSGAAGKLRVLVKAMRLAG